MNNESSIETPGFGSIKNPIQVMMNEHEVEGDGDVFESDLHFMEGDIYIIWVVKGDNRREDKI